MKNRVTVTVGGLEYNILADDDPEYVKKTAELVDRRLREMKQAGGPSAGIRRRSRRPAGRSSQAQKTAGRPAGLKKEGSLWN